MIDVDSYVKNGYDVNKIYVVSFLVRTLKSSMGRRLADCGGLTKGQACGVCIRHTVSAGPCRPRIINVFKQDAHSV